MPKTVPHVVLIDLLDDRQPIRAVIAYKEGNKKDGCSKCIGRAMFDCNNIKAAAWARGLPSCSTRRSAHYVLRPLKKSEVR